MIFTYSASVGPFVRFYLVSGNYIRELHLKIGFQLPGLAVVHYELRNLFEAFLSTYILLLLRFNQFRASFSNCIVCNYIQVLQMRLQRLITNLIRRYLKFDFAFRFWSTRSYLIKLFSYNVPKLPVTRANARPDPMLHV